MGRPTRDRARAPKGAAKKDRPAAVIPAASHAPGIFSRASNHQTRSTFAFKPDNPETHYGLAAALRGKGDIERAITEARISLNCDRTTSIRISCSATH